MSLFGLSFHRLKHTASASLTYFTIDIGMTWLFGIESEVIRIAVRAGALLYAIHQERQAIAREQVAVAANPARYAEMLKAMQERQRQAAPEDFITQAVINAHVQEHHLTDVDMLAILMDGSRFQALMQTADPLTITNDAERRVYQYATQTGLTVKLREAAVAAAPVAAPTPTVPVVPPSVVTPTLVRRAKRDSVPVAVTHASALDRVVATNPAAFARALSGDEQSKETKPVAAVAAPSVKPVVVPKKTSNPYAAGFAAAIGRGDGASKAKPAPARAAPAVAASVAAPELTEEAFNAMAAKMVAIPGLEGLQGAFADPEFCKAALANAQALMRNPDALPQMMEEMQRRGPRR